MTLDRRQVLAGAVALPVAGAAPAFARRAPPPLIHDIERRSFNYFWELGREDNGLVPDRWPGPGPCSIAAVGFALTAYPLGVEAGWISRKAARRRTLATLRFFDGAPQGDDPESSTGAHGFFYHFLDLESGLRYRQCELSSVDSTLLFLGVLFVGGWFDAPHPDEKEIRRLSARILDRADWRWFQRGRGDISMGWHPESGFIERGWTAYNEGMMVALLALGAREHGVDDDAWPAWISTLEDFWRGEGQGRHIAFAPLFGHQYSHIWFDFRGIMDTTNRAAGFDYFENSRRAAYANRAYCIANPMGWDGYSADLWGLTACDGPGYFKVVHRGQSRQIHGYAARGPLGQPDELDDGTIAPTAAIASLPFAPEIVIPAVRALVGRPGLFDRYGFKDSFNPSLRDPSLSIETGAIDPTHGWVASDYLGIDQGPILAMIANYRREAVWRVMRGDSRIRRGLARAGFEGGWMRT